MDSKAQAGLEYLMTYGWALILVATIITVLVFVVGKPGPSVAFSVSDPTKFLLKSAGVSGETGAIVLQNATGGRIAIKSITLSGDVGVVSGTKLNGVAWPTFPIDIIAGGEIRFEGLKASNNGANSRITIKYKDYADFERELVVTSGQGGPTGIGAGYSFEGDAVDASGRGANGTGGTFQDTGCVSGKCLKENTGVDGGINSRKVSNESFTYTAWVKIPSTATLSGYNPIICKSSIWTSGLWIAPNDSLRGWRVGVGQTTIWSGNSATLYSMDKVAKDVWQFIALSFDPTGDKFLHAYLNGKEVSYSSRQELGAAGNPALPVISTNPILIGLYSTYTFPGLIDEVRIYDKALSASEICSECKRFAAGAGVTCGC